MANLSRRSVLGGSGVVAATFASPLSSASADPMARKVAEWRTRWEQDERDIVLSMLPDGKLPYNDPILVETQTIARGLSALRVLKEIQETPVRDQVHRGCQAMALAMAEAFGEAVLSSQRLIRALFEDPSPEREMQLRGSLRALRLSLAEWKIEPERKKILEDLMLEAETLPQKGSLRNQLRRFDNRITRARRLIERAMDEDRGTDLLQPASRELEEEAAEGQAYWGDSAAPLSGSDKRMAIAGGLTIGVILGMMVLGAIFIGGLFLLVVGACSAACGAPEGALVALAGLAVMALAVWGGVALLGSAGVLARRAFKNPDLPELPDEDPDDPNLYLNVHPRDGWQPTGLRRGALGAAPLRATGRVYGPWGWLANPEGDGVAAGPGAPMPGAPEAGLIARVGSDLFFLGEQGTIPAGEDGPVELALNIDPAHGGRAKGFFHVVVAL